MISSTFSGFAGPLYSLQKPEKLSSVPCRRTATAAAIRKCCLAMAVSASLVYFMAAAAVLVFVVAIAKGDPSEGEVLRAESSPLYQGVPFIHCGFPSHVTP